MLREAPKPTLKLSDLLSSSALMLPLAAQPSKPWPIISAMRGNSSATAFGEKAGASSRRIFVWSSNCVVASAPGPDNVLMVYGHLPEGHSSDAVYCCWVRSSAVLLGSTLIATLLFCCQIQCAIVYYGLDNIVPGRLSGTAVALYPNNTWRLDRLYFTPCSCAS